MPRPKRERERERCDSAKLAHLARRPCWATGIPVTLFPLKTTLNPLLAVRDDGPSPEQSQTLLSALMSTARRVDPNPTLCLPGIPGDDLDDGNRTLSAYACQYPNSVSTRHHPRRHATRQPPQEARVSVLLYRLRSPTTTRSMPARSRSARVFDHRSQFMARPRTLLRGGTRSSAIRQAVGQSAAWQCPRAAPIYNARHGSGAESQATGAVDTGGDRAQRARRPGATRPRPPEDPGGTSGGDAPSQPIRQRVETGRSRRCSSPMICCLR